MRVSTLTPSQPSAIHDALVRRGLDPVRADAATRGLVPVALLFESVEPGDRDRLAEAARGQGVECLTGEGWALMVGSASVLAGLARPGFSHLPGPVADQVGRLLRGVLEPRLAWETARGTVPLERPLVAGILNVTPDSFSDGGQFLAPADAVRHAEDMLDAGADMLDIGAASTRPGVSESVSASEEWRRLEPVLTDLTKRFSTIPISVDTVSSETGRRALDEGAWALNDVSGLRLDPNIATVAAERRAGLILMHSRGTVSEMASYELADYGDVTMDVGAELQRSVSAAEERGVPGAAIVLDPGFGFAKRPEQNFALLRGLPTLAALGFPLMVGPSRKRFLGHVTGTDGSDRDNATAAACVAAYDLGAALFRVHDVARVHEALQIAYAIRKP